MLWGTRLQDAIALGVAEDQGWTVRKMTEYMSISDLRIGSSFDFAIEEDGLLEIKNVDSIAFKQGWIVDGENVEAPPHIELQAQTQLLVSGRQYVYIAALVGGNSISLLKRTPDQQIMNSIKEATTDFWKSIDANQPPEPDFSRDAAFISRLYGQSTPGKILLAQDNHTIETLVAEHLECSEKINDLEIKKEAAKAKILMEIGDAEKVVGNTFSISAKTNKEVQMNYVRKPYRGFRITPKEKKK
jgi:predicted phage-related endonuclease